MIVLPDLENLAHVGCLLHGAVAALYGVVWWSPGGKFKKSMSSIVFINTVRGFHELDYLIDQLNVLRMLLFNWSILI